MRGCVMARAYQATSRKSTQRGRVVPRSFHGGDRHEALQRRIGLDQRHDPPPKPGTLGWKINTAIGRMHVWIFQRTGGRIAGTLDGALLLILHHAGAKSGIRRQTPTI
jgi:hypothetical protein